MTSFEDACAAVERAAEATAAASAVLARAAKDVAKASKAGDVAAIRRGSDRVQTTVSALKQEASNLASAWPFSADEEERLLTETYEGELFAAASAAGLSIHRQDGRLVVFPSVVRILPGQRAVEIDRRKSTSLRPSALVAQLRASQSRKPSVSPEKFIEALFETYQLVIGRGELSSGTTLPAVYRAMTLLPDARKQYTTVDFTRDVYLLDRSAVRSTKSGATVSFPSATGTKDRDALRFVGPDGNAVSYYGIRFE